MAAVSCDVERLTCRLETVIIGVVCAVLIGIIYSQSLVIGEHRDEILGLERAVVDYRSGNFSIIRLVGVVNGWGECNRPRLTILVDNCPHYPDGCVLSKLQTSRRITDGAYPCGTAFYYNSDRTIAYVFTRELIEDMALLRSMFTPYISRCGWELSREEALRVLVMNMIPFIELPS